jgi:hypothetical protein
MLHDTIVSREELYALVWQTPVIRIAEQFGLSGNGLAKICRRLDVPYPTRGWWAKKAAGHNVRQLPLPKPRPGTPNAASIVRRERSPDIAVTALAPLREAVGGITIPERLGRAHPVIAGWRAERKRHHEQAARERDPWMQRAWSVPDFTEMEKKGHRALHALLKALEKVGAMIADGDKKGHVFVIVAGERIELEIREKLKQVKRPLNDDEKRWYSDRNRLVTELVGTGRLHVVIHTWSRAGFKREWLESDAHPIETLLPDVAATVLAMGPHLAELRREREEEARLAEERRRQADDERRRRKRDANRWRRFVEFAQASDEVRQARALVAKLRAQGSIEDIGDRSIADWLDWAEARANAVDPLERGAAALFEEIGEVSEWTYRD